MYTNADSSVNKVKYLKLSVDTLDIKSKIIAITEVKSTKNVKLNYLNLTCVAITLLTMI